MHFTAIFATVLAATIGTNALALPAINETTTPSAGNGTVGAVSMMAAGQTWTVQSFLRVCNAADTTCTFSFKINTHDGTAPTACHYKANGSPASHASYSNVACGAFTIGSSWSNQGFTVLSAVKNGLVIYPSYTDAQLASQNVVRPNQSYTPNKLG